MGITRSDELRVIRLLGVLLIGVLMLAGCGRQEASLLPYYHTPDFTPVWKAPTASKPGHKIPKLSLTNQVNQVVSNETFKNTPYIAGFFFTTCQGICPRLIKNLKPVENVISQFPILKLVMHSVVPSVDTPKVLNTYGKTHQLNPNHWQLLTGEKSEIYDLAIKGYFAEEPIGSKPDDLIHTELVTLIDHQGYIRGVYRATLKSDITKLIKDIKHLISNM